MAMSSLSDQAIVVAGGLAGLSAANTIMENCVDVWYFWTRLSGAVANGLKQRANKWREEKNSARETHGGFFGLARACWGLEVEGWSGDALNGPLGRLREVNDRLGVAAVEVQAEAEKRVHPVDVGACGAQGLR